MPTYPLTKVDFSDLLHLRDRLRANGWPVRGPLLPFVGSDFGAPLSAPRVMYVGGVGDVSADSDTFEVARLQVDGLCRDASARDGERFRSSAFWRHGLATVQAIFQAIGQGATVSSSAAIDHLYWTTYLKIAVARTGPDGDAFALQKSLAVRLLRQELKRLRPTAVVLACDDAEITRELFGARHGDWEPLVGQDLLARDLRGMRGRVYWSKPPHLLPARSLEALRRAIAEDQHAHLAGNLRGAARRASAH